MKLHNKNIRDPREYPTPFANMNGMGCHSIELDRSDMEHLLSQPADKMKEQLFLLYTRYLPE